MLVKMSKITLSNKSNPFNKKKLYINTNNALSLLNTNTYNDVYDYNSNCNKHEQKYNNR